MCEDLPGGIVQPELVEERHALVEQRVQQHDALDTQAPIEREPRLLPSSLCLAALGASHARRGFRQSGGTSGELRTHLPIATQ
jgi:hypothetical protein